MFDTLWLLRAILFSQHLCLALADPPNLATTCNIASLMVGCRVCWSPHGVPEVLMALPCLDPPPYPMALNRRCRDINVIAWNPLVHNTLASGCDDGTLRVWDLSMPQEPVAHLTYHQPWGGARGGGGEAAITSVEWSPHESAVLAASSSDNQLTVRRRYTMARRDQALCNMCDEVTNY